MIVEKFLARLFLIPRKPWRTTFTGYNVYWVPGTEDPADGLAKVRCDMAPLMWLLESGHFTPGTLRP